MASGDVFCVFTSAGVELPASSFAQFDQRGGHQVLDFDAASAENAVWSGYLPANYAGGSLAIQLVWAATSATSGAVVWKTELERNAAAFDIDAEAWATAVTATATTAAASGGLTYTTITMSGSALASLAAGNAFRLRITRDATNGSDTMAGDAELLLVIVKEG